MQQLKVSSQDLPRPCLPVSATLVLHNLQVHLQILHSTTLEIHYYQLILPGQNLRTPSQHHVISCSIKTAGVQMATHSIFKGKYEWVFNTGFTRQTKMILILNILLHSAIVTTCLCFTSLLYLSFPSSFTKGLYWERIDSCRHYFFYGNYNLWGHYLTDHSYEAT